MSSSGLGSFAMQYTDSPGARLILFTHLPLILDEDDDVEDDDEEEEEEEEDEDDDGEREVEEALVVLRGE